MIYLWRLPLWLLLATSQKMKVSSGYHFLLATSNFARWEFLVTLEFLRGVLFGYFEILRGAKSLID